VRRVTIRKNDIALSTGAAQALPYLLHPAHAAAYRLAGPHVLFLSLDHHGGQRQHYRGAHRRRGCRTGRPPGTRAAGEAAAGHAVGGEAAALKHAAARETAAGHACTQPQGRPPPRTLSEGSSPPSRTHQREAVFDERVRTPPGRSRRPPPVSVRGGVHGLAWGGGRRRACSRESAVGKRQEKAAESSSSGQSSCVWGGFPCRAR
jgi:hypothetical protein